MSTKRKLRRRQQRKIKEKFSKVFDEMLKPEVKNHKLGDAPMREYIEQHNNIIKMMGFNEEDHPEMFFDNNGERKGLNDEENGED